MQTPRPLPDDIDALKRIIEQQQQKLHAKDSLIARMHSMLERLQQQRFGPRSEKHPGQGEMQFFNEAELLAADEHGNSADSDSEEDQAAGTRVAAHTRKAPAQRGLPGSQASPTLLANIMVQKFHDGLPLYRQEKIAARTGLDLPRAKLARWRIGCEAVLQPLYTLMQEVFFSYDIALSDDTTIQVLKEDGRAPSSQSALWIRRGGPPDKPVVLVDYRHSKSG